MWERQPTNEQQTVTVDATGGAFTLSVHIGALDATTDPVATGASAGQVQAALEALKPIGSGNVSVTGGGASPYLITFVGALAGVDVQALSADGSALTGGAATATVSITRAIHNLTLIAPNVLAVMGVSGDGHRLYFVVPDGEQLVPGGPSFFGRGVFLWQDADGTPGFAFVGGVSGSEVAGLGDNRWTFSGSRVRLTPDGAHVAFLLVNGDNIGPQYPHGDCAGCGVRVV
jgi:hypothetical protein